jgi:hypothetical protein
VLAAYFDANANINVFGQTAFERSKNLGWALQVGRVLVTRLMP